MPTLKAIRTGPKALEISSFSGFPGARFLYTVHKPDATAHEHAETFFLGAECAAWPRVPRRNSRPRNFRRAGRGHHRAGRRRQRRRAQPPVAAAKCPARRAHHRGHRRLRPRFEREPNLAMPFGPIVFNPASGAENFQRRAVDDSAALDRRHFQRARRGAAHFAPVAQGEKLRLLAHRPDGGAGRGV